METCTELSLESSAIVNVPKEITVDTNLSKNTVYEKICATTDFSQTGGIESMDEYIPDEMSASTETYEIPVKSNTSKDYRIGRIKFSTLLKFKKYDKNVVLQWLMNVGLISSSYVCPACQRSMKLVSSKKTTDGYNWRCRGSRGSEHSTVRSVRKGSIFSDSRLCLTDILMYIYCWVYKLPQEWVSLEMGFNSNKAGHSLVEWWDLCRNICIEMCAKDEDKIGGVGNVVEIIGGKLQTEKLKNVGFRESWVFAGVGDIYGEKSFLRLVKKCDKKSFLRVIKNSVLSGTTVISEFCNAYNCLEDEDFVNLTMSCSYKFETCDCSKQRKSFWSTIKKSLPPHMTNKHFFDKHLAEFMWRNHNLDAYDKMERFILAIRTIYIPCNKDD